MDDMDSSGRRLYRESLTDCVVDPKTGERFIVESSRQTAETPDGAVETAANLLRLLLACGHPWRPGQAVAECEACTKEQGRTTLVCGAYSVKCPGCGRPLCMRHTRRAADNARYCRACVSRFQNDLPGFRASGRIRGLLAWLLGWW